MIDAKVEIDVSPLQGLRKTLVSKILRKATTQAARIVREAVKNNADAVKRLGFLAKSIGIKVKVYSANKIAVAVVGPRSQWTKTNGTYTRGKKKGESRVIRPSNYLHLIEKATKRSKARPVLRPALDSTQSQFLDTLAQLIAEGISAQLANLKA